MTSKNDPCDHFSFSLFRKKMDNLDETKIAAIPTLGDSVAFTTLGLYKIDMFLREHMVVSNDNF